MARQQYTTEMIYAFATSARPFRGRFMLLNHCNLSSFGPISIIMYSGICFVVKLNGHIQEPFSIENLVCQGYPPLLAFIYSGIRILAAKAGKFKAYPIESRPQESCVCIPGWHHCYGVKLFGHRNDRHYTERVSGMYRSNHKPGQIIRFAPRLLERQVYVD